MNMAPLHNHEPEENKVTLCHAKNLHDEIFSSISTNSDLMPQI